MKDNVKEVSMWWNELVCTSNEVDLEVRDSFEENVRREVGNGDNTFFFMDRWLGDFSLRDRF